MKCRLERKRIGEILIERGFITPEILDNALECQKNDPGVYVGEILIRQGLLTEIDIVTALVLQYNLPYIAISGHAVADDVVHIIPADVARRNRFVPFDRIGKVLSVVMANPMDEKVRDKVERMTDCRLATFISTGSEIDRALDRFYPLPDQVVVSGDDV